MSTRIFTIALAAALSVAAASHIPRLLNAVRVAELRILKDSESKRWGRPFMLPIHRKASKMTQ
jgi:hypothetical protein